MLSVQKNKRNGVGVFHIADVNFNLQATLRRSLRFSRPGRFQWPLLGYAFMTLMVQCSVQMNESARRGLCKTNNHDRIQYLRLSSDLRCISIR